jgi:flagellar hook assembly protein FlgD
VKVYPNPFNPATAFKGTVKFQGVKNGGKLRIWTVSGLLVWEATAGVDPVEWDGRNKSGEKVVTGVYYWTAEGETGKQKGKVLLQR